MKWTDTLEIAEALAEAHPEVNPARVNFLDLMRLAQALPGFDDAEGRCGERVLEAIQAAWIDEAR